MMTGFRRGGLRAALILGALMAGASPALAEAVLHRGNPGEPNSLDPAQISINVESFILKDLLEGLTTFNAAGEAIPGAAESWEISEDGTVYTFKLREAGKWSNGDPVTAEDFVYSLRRVQDPAVASKYANILHPIRNAKAVNAGEMKPEELGVRAVDDRTLEIVLERPTPYFLELLTHSTGLPVHRGNIEKDGAEWNRPGKLVTNGPFMLEAHIPNDSLTAAKNPHYWDAEAVKLDKVVFYPVEDQAAAVRRFEAGELDMIYNFSASDLERLRAAHGDRIRATPALNTEYYVFDNRAEPFSDARVRRALSMAIDRDFLAQEIFLGASLPTYALSPPMAGYTPAQADFAALSQFDREDQAVELMKEAGYGSGAKPLDITIRYNTNPNHERVATAIADMWKTVFGFNVTMSNQDVTSHYAYLQEGGAFQVARAGWVADYGDPENFLTLNITGNPGFNYGKYSNPDYDALIAASYDETDHEKRFQILHDAEAILMKDQPIAPLLHKAELWGLSARVKGFEDNVNNEHPSRFMSVE
ncbi:peptide ABC transporter substrate-binding protein [Neomegalonema sp.]|uniref:peptide ABC transporter substrate-binding protein n=1 Tax=Neomegalonema sp. TaxID=2039713 RepID=UPI0026087208|nr:peptide ABC transporter substrate-binding protein [Neomegalonema sp.]MDD2867576.1 peptide ABC transporter substrate-binding protein [Neomegalonema sp.]